MIIFIFMNWIILLQVTESSLGREKVRVEALNLMTMITGHSCETKTRERERGGREGKEKMWNEREREEASNEPNYRFSVLIFPEESCFCFYTEGEKRKKIGKKKK